MIYLDNAATTAYKPDVVIEALIEAQKNFCVNAGRGSYSLARKAANVIEECKDNLLKLSGINSGYQVYFSPSATISLNQIIGGFACNDYTKAYVSPFEHNAVMRPLNARCRFIQLPFNRTTWAFETDCAIDMFTKNKPDLVCISMVSNTTGYVLPCKEITALAHEYGARVVIDCAQALGAINCNFSNIGADAYVFAGHKTLLAPFGVAGMILKNDWQLSKVIKGGTGSDSLNLEMPEPINAGYEPGSPNFPAIYALNAALKWIMETKVQTIEIHEKQMIRNLRKQLEALDMVTLYAPPDEHISGILSFNVNSYTSHDVGDILDDEFDIAVRTGYHCAPLVHDWLKSKEPYLGTVRISVGWSTTEDDIEALVNAVKTL